MGVPPLVLALGAGLLSWLCVALGAGGILARREYSRRTLDMFMAVAAGMMLGATFLSLLAPALTMSAAWGRWAFVPAAVGLALGAAFLRLFDMALPHVHKRFNAAEGLKTAWARSALLALAMALHHFPEGLALGVACGASGGSGAVLDAGAAMLLTASLLLQNLPEGFVAAAVLRAEGVNSRRAFFHGALTGCTTPLGALAGAIGVSVMQELLPVALAFAGGAMLYVIVEDVIPEAQAAGHDNAATLAIIGGVLAVMALGSLLAGTP